MEINWNQRSNDIKHGIDVQPFLGSGMKGQFSDYRYWNVRYGVRI